MISLRFTLFLILSCVALTFPVHVFFIGALVYAFMYSGYELLCIGLVIDALFGYTGHIFPYIYTSGILGILFVLWCIRPYLRLYA